MKTTVLTITHLVVFFITLLTNYMGSAGKFNGMGQKEVSDKYTTLITPKGFAFAIWGVIYSLVLATLVYFFFQRSNPEVGELIRLTSTLFIVSSVFNVLWIISFSYEKLGISTVFIFGILYSLMTIIARIYEFRANFPTTLAGFAFTLYASWVFIATILNISLYLVSKDWDGFNVSESVWTIIILAAAIVLVAGYLFLYQNAAFPLAIAWAFFGIYSAYKDGTINPDLSLIIKKELVLGIVVFIFLSVITFILNGYSLFPTI